MDKFELKEKLIAISDKVGELGGSLMQKGCADDETGKLRAEAICSLEKATQVIRSIIFNIY